MKRLLSLSSATALAFVSALSGTAMAQYLDIYDPDWDPRHHYIPPGAKPIGVMKLNTPQGDPMDPSAKQNSLDHLSPPSKKLPTLEEAIKQLKEAGLNPYF